MICNLVYFYNKCSKNSSLEVYYYVNYQIIPNKKIDDSKNFKKDP